MSDQPKRGRATRGKKTWGLRILVPVVRNLSRLVFKERFEHRERIPASGPALLVLNHISVADPLATASFVWTAGRLPLFMIKDSVFKVPVVGKFFTSARQIPVSRGSSAAQSSIDRAIAALRAGEVVVVYPEGTVTRDLSFWPMRAKTGVARIALACPEVPVIPVAQWGAHRAYDYHTKKIDLLPKKETRIVALPPMDLTPFAGRDDADATRELTDLMMHTLAAEVGRMRGEEPPKVLHRHTGSGSKSGGDVTAAPDKPAPDPDAQTGAA